MSEPSRRQSYGIRLCRSNASYFRFVAVNDAFRKIQIPRDDERRFVGEIILLGGTPVTLMELRQSDDAIAFVD